MNKSIIALALAAVLAGPTIAPQTADAATSARAGKVDRRVRTFVYQQDQVYKLHGAYGYTILIELAPYEVIESIPIGESSAWQIAKINNSMVSIKPMIDNPHTNMTIITSNRVYNFALTGAHWVDGALSDITYQVKFRYPEDEAAAAAREAAKAEATVSTPAKSMDEWNMRYVWSGDQSIAPQQVFDDGEFTFFRFDKNQDVPAVFVVQPGGLETPANWRREGQFIVVERTAAAFTVRRGDQSVCIRNGELNQSVRLPNSTRREEPATAKPTGSAYPRERR